MDDDMNLKTVGEIISNIQVRREDLERRQDKLDSLYEKLIRENTRLHEHKRLLKEEILILRRAIAEMKKRGLEQPDNEYVLYRPHRILIENKIYAVPATEEEAMDIHEVKKVETPTKEELRRIPLPQKKKIKTSLHAILDAVDEKGKIKIRELAKELEMDEQSALQWAGIMARRGMLKIGYTMTGEPLIESIGYGKNPSSH